MLYSDKVMDHFNNPRNVGVIKDADGVGEVGNPVCGDIMKITFKLDGDERLDDVRIIKDYRGNERLVTARKK